MLTATPFLSGAVNVPLVTFDGAAGTTFKFEVLNDPVMGGRSHAKWDLSGDVGVLDGEVVDVPSLKAPGFVTAVANGKFADASSAASGGLTLHVRSTTASYMGFRVSLYSGAGSGEYACAGGGGIPFSRGCFKAKYTVPVGSDFTPVFVPFANFTDLWSSATGEPTSTCAEDKSACLSASKLHSIKRVELWAEGVDGKVHLEVKSVSATATTATVVEAPSEAEGAAGVGLVKACRGQTEPMRLPSTYSPAALPPAALPPAALPPADNTTPDPFHA